MSNSNDLCTDLIEVLQEKDLFCVSLGEVNLFSALPDDVQSHLY